MMHKDETLKKQSMFETLRRVIFENFDNTPQNMEPNTNLSQIINKQRAIDVLFFFTQIYIKFDLLDNSNIYALRHKEALTISQLVDAIYDEPKKNTHNDHFITTPTYTRIIVCGPNHEQPKQELITNAEIWKQVICLCNNPDIPKDTPRLHYDLVAFMKGTKKQTRNTPKHK